MVEILKGLSLPVCAGLFFIFFLSSFTQKKSGRLTLTEKDAGKSVEIALGDIFSITLSGNPTTGFSWEVLPYDPSVIKQAVDPQYKPDSSNLGASGKFTFQFEAIAPGQTELKLFYHRRWEKEALPSNTFQVLITIK